MGRGNVDAVLGDAAQLVARLRDGDSMKSVAAQYRCAYSTIMRAILSQMSLAEWTELSRRKMAASGVATRFPKGHVPWTKGRKGLHLSPVTEFKAGSIRGQAARRYRLIGSIVVRQGKRLSNQERARHAQPTRFIKVRDEGRPQDRYMPLARYLWERAHGPVPAGWFVVHADRKSMNDAPENLILVDRREHMRRLYQRHGVIAKCRQRAAAASKRRHAQNRQAKRWPRARKPQTRVIWDCPGCGADFAARPSACPKCGSSVLVERRIEPMPDSMQEPQEVPWSEAV